MFFKSGNPSQSSERGTKSSAKKNHSEVKYVSIDISVSVLSALMLGSLAATSVQAQEHDFKTVHSQPSTLHRPSGGLIRNLQGANQTLFTPPAPLAMQATITREDTRWQAVAEFTARQAPLRSTYDCAVDFNDEDALNLFVNKAADTFAYAPFWNQVCNVDVSVNLRPYYINHFHLTYEKDVCLDTSSTTFGEMQEDGTCLAFADPAKEARRLSSMLSSDVLELTAYNNYYDTRINFDLKRIRVVGNRPVRVCYKPAQQNDGDWITTEVDSASNPGLWYCWNNLSTGYWDLSSWAGDVSAVRLIAAEGHPNFSVDDILINAPPY
jgi:hypothetical protein